MDDQNELLQFVGNRIRSLRQRRGFSQEDFAFRCNLDRTYISDIERGKRNVSLINLEIISTNLGVPLSKLFAGLHSSAFDIDVASQDTYILNDRFEIHKGFYIQATDVLHAAITTSLKLEELPFDLFKSIDLKALSGIVGALFATGSAEKTGAIVNPIEKGHPDVIPTHGKNASEEELRNFPEGLEIKCTVGNVKKGSELEAGKPRLNVLNGITWQAHHREVDSLMGLIIDFGGVNVHGSRYPIITGVFYSGDLGVIDWGEISGTTGRNTKVTGMRVSGKNKMGRGWVLLLNESDYISRYEDVLGFSSSNKFENQATFKI